MLVIFDCDGVLIDSEAIYCSNDAQALTRLGYPTTAAVISERFAGIPHRLVWQILAEEYRLDLPDDWAEQILLECHGRFETELQAIEGALETIHALREDGHTLCVASSSRPETLQRNLGFTGLLEHLDPHVFSARQVKRAKPAPDVFLFAASQMGFDPYQAIVIEDSLPGVQAARRAGMRVVGFTGGGHAYEQLGARQLEAGAERSFASMAELCAYVRQTAHLDEEPFAGAQAAAFSRTATT